MKAMTIWTFGIAAGALFLNIGPLAKAADAQGSCTVSTTHSGSKPSVTCTNYKSANFTPALMQAKCSESNRTRGVMVTTATFSPSACSTVDVSGCCTFNVPHGGATYTLETCYYTSSAAKMGQAVCTSQSGTWH